jgi:hypothetical protein
MGEAAGPFTMNDVQKLLGNPQLIHDMSVKELLRVDNECGQWYFFNRSSTSPTDSESINNLWKQIYRIKNEKWSQISSLLSGPQAATGGVRAAAVGFVAGVLTPTVGSLVAAVIAYRKKKKAR